MLAQGIVPAGDAPFVHQAAFEHGVGTGYIVDGQIFLKKILILSFDSDLPQKLVIRTVGIK